MTALSRRRAVYSVARSFTLAGRGSKGEGSAVCAHGLVCQPSIQGLFSEVGMPTEIAARSIVLCVLSG